jgi:large repetitive protein
LNSLRPVCTTVATASLLALALVGASGAAGQSGDTVVSQFTEDGPAVPLAPNTTVAYPDRRVLRSARIRIVRPQTGERLHFVEQLGITGTYDSGTGILTLRGRARVPDYQTALRSVWYEHSGDKPASRRTVVIRVVDARGRRSRPGRVRVRVTGVNDAPQLAPASGRFEYGAGGRPQAIAPGIAVLDPDSAISGATVQISSNFTAAEDELAFRSRRGITGTYDSGTGVLTLTGTASPADYQAALRSVTYANGSSSPSGTSRTVSFRVTDALGEPSGVTNFDITFPRG